MKEPQQDMPADAEGILVADGEEATLVAPRFDDEETLVARPVVPLEEATAEVPTAAPDSAYAHPAAAHHPRRGLAPGRPWLLALVLTSALVGGVLGGGGLYLYQRQSHDSGASAEAPSQAQPPAGARQPSSAPTAEGADVSAPDATVSTHAAATDAPAGEGSDTHAPAQGDAATGAPPEPEHVPATERRAAPDADAGTPKRGKKGERDEEIERTRRRAGRADSGGSAVSRATGEAAAERAARRVGTITYRPGRAPRRDRAPRETAGDADRLRRIFEGTPD